MSETETQNPFAPPRAEVVHEAPPAAGVIEPAARRARLFAALLDALPLLAVGAMAALIDYRSPGSFGILALILAGIALIGWTIWNAVLLHGHGQSIGKRVLGLRVVRTDGRRVSFKRFVFLRGLPMMLIGAIPFVGRIAHLVDALMIFRSSRQCLHDVFADTLVVTAESSPRATLAGSNGGLPDIRY